MNIIQDYINDRFSRVVARLVSRRPTRQGTRYVIEWLDDNSQSIIYGRNALLRLVENRLPKPKGMEHV